MFSYAVKNITASAASVLTLVFPSFNSFEKNGAFFSSAKSTTYLSVDIDFSIINPFYEQSTARLVFHFFFHKYIYTYVFGIC